MDRLRPGSARTGRGRWVDVDGEEGFLVAGVGGEGVTAGDEGGGAAGDAVGPVGAFVEPGAGVLGVDVEGEDAQAVGQSLGAALEGVAAVEVEDLVPRGSGVLEVLDAVEVRLDDDAGAQPDQGVVDGWGLVVGADGDADGGFAESKRGHVVAAAAVEVHLAGGGLQLALNVAQAVGIHDDVGVEGLGGEAAFGDAGADGEAVASWPFG